MNDVRERMRKIRDEEQRMNVQGYSSNPWATQRLAENKAGVGVPVAGANVPNNVVMEQDGDGRWIANAVRYVEGVGNRGLWPERSERRQAKPDGRCAERSEAE
jgi:hypothetical protein